jgi:hypothetical protein
MYGYSFSFVLKMAKFLQILSPEHWIPYFCQTPDKMRCTLQACLLWLQASFKGQFFRGQNNMRCIFVFNAPCGEMVMGLMATSDSAFSNRSYAV